MNTETIVSEWLRKTAPPRVPEGVLAAALERVATTSQERVRPTRRLRALGARGSTTRLLLVAAIVGGALLLEAVSGGGGRPQRRQANMAPSVRLGAVAYATKGSIFLMGTEREHADAISIVANGTSGLSYSGPIWSRDGRYLVLSGTPTGQGARTVVVVDPQGRPVASFPGWLPSLSPDSSSIAAWDEPFRSVGIWSMDGRRRSTVLFPAGVTLPGDSTPTFTGDGQALYFVLARGSSEPKAVPIDGSAAHELSSITTAGSPVFSNDGSQVALPAIDGLYVAAGDGSAPRRVAEPAVGRFYDAVWSSTDDRIAVAWTGTAQFESLQVIDVATGRTVTVWQATPGDRVHPIRWAPDGGSILMSSGSRLYRVAVSDRPTENPSFAAEVLFEEAPHDPSTDLGADWQWILGGG